MAAQYFLCSHCHKRSPTHLKLFDALYNFHQSGVEPCPECGEERDLYLTLDFQLGAGDAAFRVLAAHLPARLESWLGENEEEVTFYPFLVRLQREGDDKEFCWMPYWHVTGKEARYGQHAVCLEQEQFRSLIQQAEETSHEHEFDLAL